MGVADENVEHHVARLLIDFRKVTITWSAADFAKYLGCSKIEVMQTRPWGWLMWAGRQDWALPRTIGELLKDHPGPWAPGSTGGKTGHQTAQDGA